jgi:acyl-CoA thioesterase
VSEAASSEGDRQRARRQAERMYEGDAASRALGIVVRDVLPGRATAEMTVTSAMVNGHGTCHGGYLFLLADTAFAFACNTHGGTVVAAGADVEFLAPVHEGQRLVAEAVERVRRGRSGVYDVTVRRGADAVVEFRGRSREGGTRRATGGVDTPLQRAEREGSRYSEEHMTTPNDRDVPGPADDVSVEQQPGQGAGLGADAGPDPAPHRETGVRSAVDRGPAQTSDEGDPVPEHPHAALEDGEPARSTDEL